MARVKASARHSTKTPLGQPNDWRPGGFRAFVILLGIGVALAAFLIGWEPWKVDVNSAVPFSSWAWL